MPLSAGLTDVNFALSFWTAVTFVILLFVLGKFAWGPILQMIELREKTIAEAIEAARKERAAAEAAAAEMMAAAKKESENLLAAARKTIQEEKRQAIAELRALAVDLAIEAAHKLVQM